MKMLNGVAITLNSGEVHRKHDMAYIMLKCSIVRDILWRTKIVAPEIISPTVCCLKITEEM